MEKMFAMAIPVSKGKEEAFHQFINDLRTTYSNDFQNARKRLGIRERTFLQQTPEGSLVIVTLTGNDPEQSFRKLALGNDEFTKWFINKVKEIHGIDLTSPPPGPMPEMIVDSGVVEEVAMS